MQSGRLLVRGNPGVGVLLAGRVSVAGYIHTSVPADYLRVDFFPGIILRVHRTCTPAPR